MRIIVSMRDYYQQCTTKWSSLALLAELSVQKKRIHFLRNQIGFPVTSWASHTGKETGWGMVKNNGFRWNGLLSVLRGGVCGILKTPEKNPHFNEALWDSNLLPLRCKPNALRAWPQRLLSFKDIKLYNIINAPFFIYTPIERVSGRIRLENIHFFLLIHKLV